MRLAVQNSFAAIKQFRLVELSLSESEILDSPSRDLGEAFFCKTCQPEGSAHQEARAFAKARRMASSPLPSAKSPALA